MGISLGLTAAWNDFAANAALDPADYMSGVQKIIHNFTWSIPASTLFDPDTKLTDFGYSERGQKIKALIRHYYDEHKTEGALQLVADRVQGRKYGSAGFALTGEKKTWTKQDFCMQAATVTHFPDSGLRIVVFYRTTEVIKKFSADLIFLRDIVLPQFHEIEPIREISFRFSNVTVHPMFFPTLLAHHMSPVRLLEQIEIADPRFHTGIQKWMIKYLFEGDTSWVQKFSQARQTHAAMHRLMTKRQLRTLKKYFGDYR